MVRSEVVEGPEGTDVLQIAPTLRELLQTPVDYNFDGDLADGQEGVLDAIDNNGVDIISSPNRAQQEED